MKQIFICPLLLFFALTCQLYMIIKEFLYEITIRNMF